MQSDVDDGLARESSVNEAVLNTRPTPAYEAEALDEALGNMRKQLDSTSSTQFLTAASAVTTASSLTVGYVLWAIRGGWLASSILAQMPAWRLVDPLVVLSGLTGSEAAGGQSLQDMIRDGVDQSDHSEDSVQM